MAVFLMVIRPTLSSEVDGASCTALPANDGEERAMVEAAIVEFVVRDNLIREGVMDVCIIRDAL